MHALIQINPALDFYFLHSEGFIVSDGTKETFIQNDNAAEIVRFLEHPQEVTHLIERFSHSIEPARVMQILASLQKNQFVKLVDSSSEVAYSQLDLTTIKTCLHETDDASLSTSFFARLLFNYDSDRDVYYSVSQTSIFRGPKHRHPQSACEACFKARLLSHRPLLHYVTTAHNLTDTILAKFNVQQCVEPLLDLKSNPFEGVSDQDFCTYHFDTKEVSSHRVLPLGECSQCKQHQHSDDFFNELSTFKHNTQVGYRTSELQDTYNQLIPLVDSTVGVIAKLEPYRDVASPLLCNYTSGRNLAFSASNLFWLSNHIRSASGGKGKTPLQAQVSALCESVERYSMVYQGQATAEFASYNQLKDTHAIINPASILNFSESQFANRAAINNKTTLFHQLVPEPFNPDKPMHWSEGFSLTEQKKCLILTEQAFAKFNNDQANPLVAYPDSNGCASGNNVLEAVLQGTLELIERDAAAIWWYNRCIRSSVNIASINNEYISNVAALYLQRGRSLKILNITSDLAIPCFVAVSVNLKTRNEIIYGFGCHLDAHIAIERAVTELNQILPLTSTKRSETSDQTLYHWMDQQIIDDHPYLDAQGVQEIDFNQTFTDKPVPMLSACIQYLVERLSENDISLIAFNLTQKDTRLPVVKMIAPGLRHFWRRTAPGRLYTVPVKMGLRSTPLDEKQLNPHSISI